MHVEPITTKLAEEPVFAKDSMPDRTNGRKEEA